MLELIDKGFLLLSCLIMGFAYSAEPFIIVPLLISIALSSAITYTNSMWLRCGSLFAVLVFGVLQPVFMFFVPLFLYDLYKTRLVWLSLLTLPPFVVQYSKIGLPLSAILLLFYGAAFLLKHKTYRQGLLNENLHHLRDSAAELNIQLNNTNKELRSHQDEQVHSAMLMERNRIAREIHDNVGHLLSSAMLQLGALLATAPTEETREPLRTLKETLSEAMGSIRQSVHGLYDESVDLQLELTTLIRNFTFCVADLDYDVQTPPDRRIKYAFLAVVKEALSNTAKHSKATHLSVAVREHPALYQLDIRDNGKNAAYPIDSTSGIGIDNMKSRVSDLHGRFLITTEQGFHLFISIPKEGTK